ncbi:hypothetical protein IX27_18275 [Streptomyces sp. JS01]|uniref:hypothetical protein n=1 Tax=Streptomyces sp. JS01 TaxID=1525753 RepID=UPI000502E190|nr:hypothetical protein [Streptomyces sp. JS01]KFK87838.1 hypothetical protein IX27_18275 [Streptomyces sp. JS01]
MRTADFFARQITQEEEIFASDARSAADLMNRIADEPNSTVVSGDIARLIQQAAELHRRAAKIAAWREAHSLMNAPAT